MKKKYKLTLGVIWTILFLSFFNPNSSNIEVNLGQNNQINFEKLKTSDASISINSKADLDLKTDRGTGTFSDPYIIENKTIDGGGSPCIQIIGQTQYYIEIRNCTLSNANNAISLINMANCTIKNNTISANSVGIAFQACNNCSIIDNKVLQNTGDRAVYIYQSDYINISLNTITNNAKDGIFLYLSDNNIIYHNTINDNGEWGILLFDSIDNQITYNTLHRNKDGCIGIDVDNIDNNTQSNNDCVPYEETDDDDSDDVNDKDDELVIYGYNQFILLISLIMIPLLVYSKRRK